MELKLSGDFLLPSQQHHVGSKLFKDAAVSDGIRLGESISCDRILSKSKMIGSLSMCNGNISKFAQTLAADKLAEHQNRQMVPARKTPLLGTIMVFFDDSPEKSLRKEHRKLGEKIVSGVHTFSILNMDAKVPISNVGHAFRNLKYFA